MNSFPVTAYFFSEFKVLEEYMFAFPPCASIAPRPTEPISVNSSNWWLWMGIADTGGLINSCFNFSYATCDLEDYKNSIF